ncbi:MAG: NUDIX hydrolase [Candidatus Dormibacteria bacterium]
MLALLDPGDPDLPLLLLQRSSELRAHPGQAALPGGSAAPEDGPLWQTALRESWEELGVPRGAVDLRGRASVVPTFNSGFAIVPFVGLLAEPFEPAPEAQEVASYFWLPLLPRGVPATPVRREVRLREGGLQARGYLHQEHFVWGATGAIVADLLGRLAL